MKEGVFEEEKETSAYFNESTSNDKQSADFGADKDFLTIPTTENNDDGDSSASKNQYELLLKVFAIICAVVFLTRVFKTIKHIYGLVTGLIYFFQISAIINLLLSVVSLAFCLSATIVLILLALRRTKENSEALFFGVVASAGGLLIVRLAVIVLSILLNIIYQQFHFGLLSMYLSQLVNMIFWLAVCICGIWGILFLMKEELKPADVISNIPVKLSIIVDTLKTGAGDARQQAGVAVGSAKSNYEMRQQQRALAKDEPVRIQTNRSLLAFILLSMITCGLYSFYFVYTVAQDVNIICREDGEKTGGLLAFILLSIVTCGFYSLYWEYTLANRMAINAQRYGLSFPENGTNILLWHLLGLLMCGLGPLVAMHILIKNINALAAAYNIDHGL